MALRYFPDVPAPATADPLHFERYRSPLVELLLDENTQTPFTIGIFGPWGSGKSSLLQQLETELTENHSGKFVCVSFNPWIHRREPNLLIPLLHCLHDALENWKTGLAESSARIFHVLAQLSADLLLKTITFDAVDLDRLETLEKRYLESHRKVESEMRTLRKTLAQVATDIGNSKGRPRLVFLIDDLDRCQPEDIVDVLESVKLFLDVPNVVVLLAVDKEVIDKGIEIRYKKLELDKDRAAAVGAEYLEKIVQLPLTLLPLDETQIRSLLNKMTLPSVFANEKDWILKMLLPNPRKILRVVNNLAFAEAVLRTSRPKEWEKHKRAIIALMILQAQDSALYDAIARQPERLTALQIAYKAATDKKPPVLTQFNSARAMSEWCESKLLPGSYQALIFGENLFDQKFATGILPVYLTLLGTP